MARKLSQAWHTDRRRRVKQAVRMKRMTLCDYADHLGVTHTHLNYVLRGVRSSARLDHEVWRLLEWAFGTSAATSFRPSYHD